MLKTSIDLLKTQKPYNIVCVSDEGYVQHTAVMLCSLFETNKNKNFNIYLLTSGISNESEVRLKELCQNYNSFIYIKVVVTSNINDLPIGQWNTIMYLKLFIPRVLPTNTDRCLFLDVDMIINADIAPLYNINLEGNVLAATEDIPDCVAYKPRIGLMEGDLYINSGVMVCDLMQWRIMEQDCPIFDFTRSMISKIQNEQDVIAMYFKNNIKCLPIRWNMVTFYFRRNPLIFHKYLPQLKEAKQNPAVIHFACPIKPWFRDCQHPYKGLYFKYLSSTTWQNYQAPFYENLTVVGRVKKKVRVFLNKYDVLNDELYCSK